MKLLVTGARGMLARAVRAVAHKGGHEVLAYDHADLDVTDAIAVEAILREHRPEAVVQCAAYTSVDEAESDEAGAFAVNATATGIVARACAQTGARLVYPSTDYVFDGSARVAYRPDDAPAPINTYGRSKFAGEQAAREAGSWLTVRTSWLYGAGGRNFVSTMLDRARSGEPLRVVDDQVGSPTWTEDLAGAMLGLLSCDAPSGTYHVCNRGETSWYGLARATFELAGHEVAVEPVSSDAFPRPAARPRYSVLDCKAAERLIGPLPHWKDSLARALEVGL